MNELALFAGAGGGLLASKLLGWSTVCAVEIDRYCRKILRRRQIDGSLDTFPIWDDVCTFDGNPWRGVVDIISGGFPCQDISSAGKRAGIATGKRSGLWREYARIVDEVRPTFVFIENSPRLVSCGLDIVLSDLTDMGYDARWCVLGAWHVGSPHKRDRIWILAYSSGDRHFSSRERQNDSRGNGMDCFQEEVVCPAFGESNRALAGHRLSQNRPEEITKTSAATSRRSDWWETEPGMGRVVNGMAHRVDRLRVIGNGQVPAVAAVAFRLLSTGLTR